MLEVARQHGFIFDTVQMPLNVMDAHYHSIEKLVLPELVRQNTGVLDMKSIANGLILRSHTVTAVECLHYALNLPTSVVHREARDPQPIARLIPPRHRASAVAKNRVRHTLASDGRWSALEVRAGHQCSDRQQQAG